jgi:hypothetical protein
MRTASKAQDPRMAFETILKAQEPRIRLVNGNNDLRL